MTLTTQSELENTRTKLSLLEGRYEDLRAADCNDRELRQATLLSLKRYINQFKEEIARYEAVHQR
jgi:hypothetical protein